MKSTLFWACASLLIPFSSAVWQNFENLKSKTPVKEQELAVRGLISRLLSDRESEFTVVVDPTLAKPGQDAFTLQTVAKKLVLTGTTGVAAAWAFYHFLKYDCKAHISWSGNQLETIPKPLPVITQIEKVVVPHRYVCWTCSI
jgi:alpha-N-acetylglucosaminidase